MVYVGKIWGNEIRWTCVNAFFLMMLFMLKNWLEVYNLNYNVFGSWLTSW